VIPTLNREKTIGPCLKSIAKQNYPLIEIIVVDGGSHDLTTQIASEYATKVISDYGSLGRARQVGAESSTGEILGIFDSDIVLPSQNWLFSAIKKFNEDNNVGIVWAAKQQAPKNGSLVSRCFLNLHMTFLKERLDKSRKLLPGGNSLILRKVFFEVGGFNTLLHFGEDVDLSYRIIRLGYKFALAEQPILHNTMLSLTDFARKQIWGASSILGIKDDKTKANMLDACMTWKFMGENNVSLRHLVNEAFFRHILIGLEGMMEGLIRDRDRSWALLPLLLYIRTMVYGIFFLRSKVANLLTHAR